MFNSVTRNVIAHLIHRNHEKLCTCIVNGMPIDRRNENKGLRYAFRHTWTDVRHVSEFPIMSRIVECAWNRILGISNPNISATSITDWIEFAPLVSPSCCAAQIRDGFIVQVADVFVECVSRRLKCNRHEFVAHLFFHCCHLRKFRAYNIRLYFGLFTKSIGSAGICASAAAWLINGTNISLVM